MNKKLFCLLLVLSFTFITNSVSAEVIWKEESIHFPQGYLNTYKLNKNNCFVAVSEDEKALYVRASDHEGTFIQVLLRPDTKTYKTEYENYIPHDKSNTMRHSHTESHLYSLAGPNLFYLNCREYAKMLPPTVKKAFGAFYGINK